MPRPPHKIRPSAYAAANLKRMGRILQGSLQPLKPNQHFGKALASGAIIMSSAGSESPNSMEALFYERSCVWVGWFEKRSQVDSVGVGCPSWTYKWLFGWNKKSMWTKQKFYKWQNVVGAHRRAVLQMLCVSTTTALAWSNDHCQWIFTAVKPPCSPDLTIWLCLFETKALGAFKMIFKHHMVGGHKHLLRKRQFGFTAAGWHAESPTACRSLWAYLCSKLFCGVPVFSNVSSLFLTTESIRSTSGSSSNEHWCSDPHP